MSIKLSELVDEAITKIEVDYGVEYEMPWCIFTFLGKNSNFLAQIDANELFNECDAHFDKEGNLMAKISFKVLCYDNGAPMKNDLKEISDEHPHS